MNRKLKRSTLLLTSALGLSLALGVNAQGTPGTAGNAQGTSATVPDKAGSPTRAQAATGTGAANTGAASGTEDGRHMGDANRNTGRATLGREGDAKAAQNASVEVRASKLIGRNVESARGENLGEIKDLVIDNRNGKVHYAVVSMGGFLGLGDKLYAVPIQQFQPTGAGDRDKLRLNVDKERMKQTRGIDANQWPDLNDSSVRTDFDRPFQASRQQAQGQAVRMVRASKLLDADVKDRTGNDVGDVEDLVVNLRTGEVRHVVVQFDRAWTPDNKLVAMPMKAFVAEDGDRSDLVYQADKDRLQNAPSFDRNAWPNVNDDRFRTESSRYEQTWLNQPAR